MKLMFDFSMLEFEEVPYMALLIKLLTRLGTKNYDLSDLTDTINIETGGIKASINIYGVKDSTKECMPRLEVKFKCFSGKVEETVALVREVIYETLLSDEKKIMDLILETKSRLTMSLMGSGHTASITRSLSYHTISGRYKDYLEGIGYYDFITSISLKA